MLIPKERAYNIGLARRYIESANSLKNKYRSKDFERAGDYWLEAGKLVKAEDAYYSAFLTAFYRKKSLKDFKRKEKKRIKDLAAKIEDLGKEIGPRVFSNRPYLGPTRKISGLINYQLRAQKPLTKKQRERMNEQNKNSENLLLMQTNMQMYQNMINTAINNSNPPQLIIYFFIFLLAIFFLSPNITGFTIFNINKSSSNFFGIFLIFLGIFLIFIFLKKKKKG